MSERTDQRERETGPDPAAVDRSFAVDDPTAEPDVDPEPGPEDRRAAARESALTDRLRARLASPFGGLFSVRLFVLLTLATFVLSVLASVTLPLGGVAGYAGIAVTGFLVGIALDRGRYLEFLLAGAVSSAAATVVGNLVLTTLGIGLPLAVVGAAGGGIAGVVGHYFGRDLRDGLTREV